MTGLLERTVTPTENDRKLALESTQFLMNVNDLAEVRLQLIEGETHHVTLALPTLAFRVLNEILAEMAK